MFDGDTRLEWHPAIRALAWALDWSGVACGAAILCELLVSRRELPAHVLRIGARAAVFAAAMAFSVPLLMALEFWWSGVQHARREYSRPFATALLAVYTTAALVLTGMYALIPLWLLPGLWRGLSRWAAAIEPFHPGSHAPAGPGAVAGLLAGCAVAASIAIPFGYFTFRNYTTCIRGLGLRRVLRGVAIMVLLRLRQPRRDFFKMTPLIGDVFPLAFCVVLYEVLPVSPFTGLLVMTLVVAQISMSLDRIRPPTWLYLGTSEYESFWVFDDLRHNWERTAVCLLDRSGKEGYKFYQAEREKWSRNSWLPTSLFYDPMQPRVWSIRTRPDLWWHTVVLLTDFVPVIVVDLRRASDFVLDEVRWLADPSRIGKALFLAGDEGLLPMYDEAIPASARDRVLTGEALYACDWRAL